MSTINASGLVRLDDVRNRLGSALVGLAWLSVFFGSVLAWLATGSMRYFIVIGIVTAGFAVIATIADRDPIHRTRRLPALFAVLSINTVILTQAIETLGGGGAGMLLILLPVVAILLADPFSILSAGIAAIMARLFIYPLGIFDISLASLVTVSAAVAATTIVSLVVARILKNVVETAEDTASRLLADIVRLRLALVERSRDVLTRDEFVAITQSIVERVRNNIGNRILTVSDHLNGINGSISAIHDIAGSLSEGGKLLAHSIDQARNAEGHAAACTRMSESLEAMSSKLTSAALQSRGTGEELQSIDHLIETLARDLDSLEDASVEIDRLVASSEGDDRKNAEAVRTNVFALSSALRRTIKLLDQRLSRATASISNISENADLLAEETLSQAKGIHGISGRMREIGDSLRSHIAEIETLVRNADQVKSLLNTAKQRIAEVSVNSRELLNVFTELFRDATRDVNIRAHPRVSANFPVVISQDGRRTEGRAINISKQGILVATSRPKDLSPGTADIEMDETIGKASCFIVTVSDVGLHIRFEDMTDEVRDAIDEFVESSLAGASSDGSDKDQNA